MNHNQNQNRTTENDRQARGDQNNQNNIRQQDGRQASARDSAKNQQNEPKDRDGQENARREDGDQQNSRNKH